MTSRRRLLALVLGGSLLVAPAVSGQALSPRTVNWEEFFSIDWSVAERNGSTVLRGYVRGGSKYGARWMQLLVDRLDASGTLIDQRLVWLPSEVPRGNQVYFEVRVEPAARYRVAVYAYEPPPRP